jgi:thiamine-monophosphate kinase
VVGGNLSRGTETSVTTTLLGRVDEAIVRSGARPGDSVWLSGPVGLAAAGLAALLADGVAGLGLAACVEAWRRPRARIAEGRALRGVATAAVDVSDGLARDVGHLAVASDVRVVLDEAALLAHGGAELERAAGVLGRDPLELALHGGEDYALVATGAAAEPAPGFVNIGRIEPAAGAPGVLLARASGVVLIESRGFDHFERG